MLRRWVLARERFSFSQAAWAVGLWRALGAGLGIGLCVGGRGEGVGVYACYKRVLFREYYV